MTRVYFLENERKFKETLSEQVKDIFKQGDKVAIKLHMGEPGNKTRIDPAFVKQVVDVLQALGCKPFLFDSPVRYESQRNTPEGYIEAAKGQGFSDETMGCPVVVTNDFIRVKGQDIVHEVCKTLADADGVLVLSHVKGHLCTGFGGAIKNLGMGAVTKESKGMIHEGGKPTYEKGCTLCGECAKHCPTDNIRYDSKRPFFDNSWCCGCSNCVIFCPEKAIRPNLDTFDYLLAEAAKAALDSFKKVYNVNWIYNLTQRCDCPSDPGPIVMDDVGIVMGEDIVAVEKASHDLIVERAGKDIFEEIHHKSPLVHIKEAEKLGMGKSEYELVKA
jgi:uncharacterized Fe-S center protein